jgi:hypothetical protein
MSAPMPGSTGLAPAGARRRAWILAGVVALCLCVALGYAWRQAGRARAAAHAPSGALLLEALPDPAAAGAARPYVLFRHGAPDEHHGRLALRFLDEPEGRLAVAPLACERVAVAAGTGLCLQAHRKSLTTYEALVFDRRFRVLQRLSLAGPPSRARLSADGRLAAVTVFVSGHSYAGSSFTTRTSLMDTRSGRWLAEDLERFEVLQDGRPIRAADFNFWGVSFAGDGPRFVATLHTGGRFLLVEGDVAARRMRVVHDDVECPSLSPDARRVAFKRRVPAPEGGRFAWRLVVLELDGGRETALTAETQSVDDQVAWLDDGTLLYARPQDATRPGAEDDVWALPIDNRSAPRRLLRQASSPAPGR